MGTIDWTTILIGLFGAVGGVGIWQFLIVRSRLDAKERQLLSAEWQGMNDRLIAAEKNWIDTLRKERESLTAQIERERARTIDLENRLGRLASQNAGLQTEIQRLAIENGTYQRAVSDLTKDKNQLTDRVRKLERILANNGLDTGPLKRE